MSTSAFDRGLDEAPRFFLRSLHISGFRSIRNAELSFRPGLNVIIGENNAAKSSVIDALRIMFNLGSFENREDTIRLRHTDIHIDEDASEAATSSISFTAAFWGRADGHSPAQFYEMLCPEELGHLEGVEAEYAVFRLHLRADFTLNSRKRRYEFSRREIRGGPALLNPVPAEVLDYIRSIYLAPLRDLVNDRSRVGAEIERLILSHTLPDQNEQRQAIPGQLRELANELIEAVTDNRHQSEAGEHLARYAAPYGIGAQSLSFLPAGISEALFTSMWPVFAHELHGGEDKLPLSSNGLGINQLIYASIVLARRGAAEVDDHTHKFFLIEEPEAHLHPQLQDSFFGELNQIRRDQVFVTSHSPSITARADVDRIILMRRGKDRTAIPLHLVTVFADREDDRRYLQKFLDVTRSQLLFARGALFVEGVTEGMLMQRFSEMLGNDLRKAGIEIVVVDSDYGFDHFRPLFEHEHRTHHRAAFVTDNDELATEVASDAQLIGASLGAFDTLPDPVGSARVYRGYGTFEFGLLCASVADEGNDPMYQILREAMRRAAPPSVRNQGAEKAFLDDFLNRASPALSYRKMKESKKGSQVELDEWEADWHTRKYFRAAKSDFAFYLDQILAELGPEQARTSFTIPAYIRAAIEFVTQAETAGQVPDAGD